MERSVNNRLSDDPAFRVDLSIHAYCVISNA